MNVTVDIGQLLIGIVVLFNCYQSWRNSKMIDIVHKATNSMKDELVKVTGESEFARGVKAGQDTSKES